MIGAHKKMLPEIVQIFKKLSVKWGLLFILQAAVNRIFYVNFLNLLPRR